MSNRRPVYHQTNDKLRVISSHNGLWVAQKWVGRTHPQTQSGWENIGSPMSRDDAIEQMMTTAT